MIMVTGYTTQDTIKPQLVIRINTDKLLPDSVFRKLDEVPAHIRYADSVSKARKPAPATTDITITDTTSVSTRITTDGFTFSDPGSFIRFMKPYPQGQFPFQLAKKAAPDHGDLNLTIIKPLKEGNKLPENSLHYDWITALLFLSALLYLLVRKPTRSIFTELSRFFLFRGINESSSRDTGSLFFWQSTILNFVSFLVIGLFAYCAAAYYAFIPENIAPFMFLLILLSIVVFSVTSRHLICIATGSLSGHNEAFNEYLMTVYKSYRYSAVTLFILVTLLVYTVLLPSQVYFIIGVIALIIFYLYRVARLLLIFIRRNISILYLILYLCALEILPVLILLKYFKGLV
jgi:hypothetical protein